MQGNNGDPPAHQGLDGEGPPGPSSQSFQPSSSRTNRPPPRRVDHTYRDYSNFPSDELPAGKKVPTNFPSKLHQILSNPEYSHVSRMAHYWHTMIIDIETKNVLMNDPCPYLYCWEIANSSQSSTTNMQLITSQS